MKTLLELVGIILIILSLILMTWLVVTLPYWLFWNYILVPIFGIVYLNFAQCMILAFLINIGFMAYASIYSSEKVPDDRDI